MDHFTAWALREVVHQRGGIRDDLRVEGAAVGELHPLAQLEGELVAGGVGGEALRHARHQLGAARGVVQQALVHVVEDLPGVEVVGFRRVQVGQLLGGAVDQALLRLLRAASEREAHGNNDDQKHRSDSLHISSFERSNIFISLETALILPKIKLTDFVFKSPFKTLSIFLCDQVPRHLTVNDSKMSFPSFSKALILGKVFPILKKIKTSKIK